ncbi:hypothetical protein LOK49_LG09G01165 [Camellia lanceoleosa]|uniref:Uncharacterized protein n=1 Tax=Camellia lanceoleosa TaxID=1840588 RepID=A0ACC0GKL7_9ERIC|nr:hypothetical protein LOK49_LG09G01165 [Camellia lanceoleosa]
MPAIIGLQLWLMVSMREEDDDLKIMVSEKELLKDVAENLPFLFLYAATELNHRANQFYSSCSGESVIANVQLTRLLPFTTRPIQAPWTVAITGFRHLPIVALISHRRGLVVWPWSLDWEVIELRALRSMLE